MSPPEEPPVKFTVPVFVMNTPAPFVAKVMTPVVPGVDVTIAAVLVPMVPVPLVIDKLFDVMVPAVRVSEPDPSRAIVTALAPPPMLAAKPIEPLLPLVVVRESAPLIGAPIAILPLAETLRLPVTLTEPVFPTR